MKDYVFSKTSLDSDVHNSIEAANTFDELIVCVNSTRLTLVSNDAYVYCSSLFDFTVGVNDIKGKDGGAPSLLTLKLCSKDTGEVLYEKDFMPEYDGDYCTFDISDDVKPLKAGHYILKILNAVPSSPCGLPTDDYYQYTFSFKMLPSGKDIPHVMPREASFRLLRNKNGDGRAVVDIKMGAEVTSLDLYEISCFDSSLVPAGWAKMRLNDKRSNVTLTTQLEASRPWLKKTYTLFLFHNGIPFAHASFTPADGSQRVPLHIERLDTSSLEYILADLCKPQSDLARLCEMEGCKQIKRKALQHLQASAHNALRHKQNVADINLCCSYIFYGNSSRREIEAIKFFVTAAFGVTNIESVDIDTLASPYAVTDPTESAASCFSSGNKAFILLNADSLMWDRGHAIAKVIESVMMNGDTPRLIFHGTRVVMEQLERAYPTLMSHVPQENRLAFAALSADDVLCGVHNVLSDMDMHLSHHAAIFIHRGISQRLEDGTLGCVEMGWCADFVSKALMPRFRQRMYANMKEQQCSLREFLTTVKSGDIDWQSVINASSLSSCLDEINAMTGLSNAKKTLNTIAMKARFDAMRRKKVGEIADKGVYHMVFTGNPGTGKTTVAKMVGKVFHALGLLSKGEVLVTERSQLVGRFLGQTEENVRNVLRQAQGNVLFIDEAYTLCDTTADRKDFGYRVLECLLTLLSQKSPDMVVIMAGYEKEMEMMMSANQGLRGRFPYHIHFDDYSASELFEIAYNYLSTYDICLTEEASSNLMSFISSRSACRDRNFSNARWIEQFIDNALIPVLSSRMLTSSASSPSEPVIIAADISEAAAMMPVEKTKQGIGFTLRA